MFDALYAPAERSHFESLWHELAANRRRFDVVSPNVSRTGDSLWCRWKLGSAYADEGQGSRITGVVDDVTKQYRAEAALRVSEERFRRLIEAAPIAIGMHRDGIGVYSNKAHCRLFGCEDASQLIGKPLIELVAPEERAAIRERVRRRARGESVETSYEFTALRLDGSRFRAATFVLPLELPEGPTVVTFHTDMTERRHAEELNRRIVETAAEGIWAIDDSQRTVFVNERMCEMLGYSEAEFRARLASDFMTESTASDLHVHEARRRAGESYTREASFLRKDGRQVDLSVAGAPLRDENGRFEGMFGMFTDITDRKRTERALRESEERFRAVLEQASVGFVLVEVDGSVLEWNNAVERITGIAREAALGCKVWDVQQRLLAPERRNADATVSLKAMFEQLVSLGGPQSPATPESMKIWRPDGSSRHMLQVLYPIRVDKSGYRIGQVLWDITDAQRAEEAQRTADARLRHAQKMEALGTLAGGVAHDFNNILAAIMGFTQVVHDDIPDRPEAQDDLGQVLKACRRAKDLVQQILAFSRRAPQCRRPTDLGGIVKEAVRLLRSTLPATIELVCVVAEELPLVLSDSTQIHQVIMNLCTNAAHAMEGKPGKLTIELSAIELTEELVHRHANLASGRHVQLSVSDSGRGMDSATLARIFEPFFTTKATGDGTGLGLSVVHGIVAEHQGAIEVESHVGVGSCFRVLLPTFKGSDSRVESGFGVLPVGNGQAILVVDDEVPLCQWLERTLKRLGYCPVTMTDPLAALELIRAEPSRFSLLITDLAMPKMSGLELITNTRSLAPSLPVLLTTGHASGLRVETMQELGVHGLLEKPASISELAATVRSAIQTDP